MLVKILKKIQQDKQISIQQLSRIFLMNEDSIEPLLEFWIQRGKIHKLSMKSSACGSKCFGCSPSGNSIYQAE